LPRSFKQRDNVVGALVTVTATQITQVLRKDIDTERLLTLLPNAGNIEFWRSLNPALEVTDDPLARWQTALPPDREISMAYRDQLRTEGYFQTPPLLAESRRRQMLQAIEAVRAAGFPNMFALVYDVFFHSLVQVSPVLAGILGQGWQIIPNFWVYYVEPSDQGRGFEPHRDAEYPNTLDESGFPKTVTAWITVTEATPLNSCMYLLPRNRDSQYDEAVHNLKTGWHQMSLQDLRALPTPAGTLSCWDQYVFHYGSRSSKRAPAPRVSIAFYCQRGDIPPVDDRVIRIPSDLDFRTRLGIICRGLRRYSYVTFRDSPESEPLLAFLNAHAL
jgi:hypothetical protein